MTALTSSAAMHTATSPRDRSCAEQKVSPTDAPQGFFLVCFQDFPPNLHPYPHLKPLTAVRSRPRTAAQRPGMGLLRALLPTVPPLSPSEPHDRSEAEACSSVPYGPTYGSNWCFVPLETSQPPSRPRARATPKPPGRTPRPRPAQFSPASAAPPGRAQAESSAATGAHPAVGSGPASPSADPLAAGRLRGSGEAAAGPPAAARNRPRRSRFIAAHRGPGAPRPASYGAPLWAGRPGAGLPVHTFRF